MEKEKDREKEKVGDRSGKLNEKKSDRELEREIRSHLLEEQHENFVGAVKKNVNMNRYDISSMKRVTRNFLEVSRCSRVKQRQRNVQKSVLHVQSCFFAN